MPVSQKKSIVQTMAGVRHFGYLPSLGFVGASPQGAAVEMLDAFGRVLALPLETIRLIAFVREWNLDDATDPERLSRRTFLARPRSEGLWVRLTFLDGSVLEGLAPIDVSLLDGMLADRGLHLLPPDARSNTQRLFIPRSSLASMQLLAVITSPSKTVRSGSRAAASVEQNLLFPEPDELQSGP